MLHDEERQKLENSQQKHDVSLHSENYVVISDPEAFTSVVIQEKYAPIWDEGKCQNYVVDMGINHSTKLNEAISSSLHEAWVLHSGKQFRAFRHQIEMLFQQTSSINSVIELLFNGLWKQPCDRLPNKINLLKLIVEY